MQDDFATVLLKTDGLRVLVIGGGNVALRKCRNFKGAKIAVVAKDVLPELASLASDVVLSEFNDAILNDVSADIVIAATDDHGLNDAIVRDATKRGLFINSAHGGGNVLIPSVLEREGYMVAVSSLGSAPAFPPFLVKELDRLLDERYDLMLRLLSEIRIYAKEVIPMEVDRRRCISSVVDSHEVMELVRNGEYEAALTVAKGMVR